ncbi:MAG: hypothetical protein M3347_06710, partial [Armatimonadota bacterium]|nr:hypothetical protein [Armatimonadota bacterium]
MRNLLLLLGSLAGAASAQAPTNLVKNGSFEGAARYWFNAKTANVARGDAAFGEYYLNVPKAYVQSAPFPLEDGKPVTISFSARADTEREVWMTCHPSHREIAQQSKLIWSGKPVGTLKAGPQWRRASFTFTPNVAHNGWWPKAHYMLMIGAAKDQLFQLDGVTVSFDGGSEKPVLSEVEGFRPRRAIEVLVDSPDLKGFVVNGNLLDKGATVSLAGFASNPGDTSRQITLRWQLFDYEGTQPVGAPVDKKYSIAPGKTVGDTVPLKLERTGLVLARVAALGEDGQVIDSSDLPLTSLPYPKSATAPDGNERFGGSFFGLNSAGLARQIGFRWSRWHPHFNFGAVQPKGPDDWQFPDQRVDALAALGYSIVAVFNGRPKWAYDEKSPEPNLPKDMQWGKDDPQWDDLTVETSWDKYVKTTVAHFKGKPIIWELWNEPELARWKDYEVYYKFTTRTARLIKGADPAAKVMLNATWGGPTDFMKKFFDRGGARFIDAASYHDYHEGWLSDARGFQAMRDYFDEHGGKHVAIWFDEGWTFTNSAVDEPALALGRLTAAESTNAMVASVAELTAVGQEKTIIFHTSYEDHGHSFWDYYAPGTMLWDFYGYALPLAPAWNTLIHHVGLSERVAFIRPLGANLCIFEDKRNGRGVIVAYAEREAKNDATVELPFAGVMVEDIMGNAAPLRGNTVILPKNGRPLFIYANDKTSGQAFAAKLRDKDRKLASFVEQSAQGAVYRLPQVWQGAEKGTPRGNPIETGGQPIWRLDQIWPDDPLKVANYIPMIWTGREWKVKEHEHGGQPTISIADGRSNFGVRGAWGGNPGQKIAALSFIAPKSGTYTLNATAVSKPWDGG